MEYDRGLAGHSDGDVLCHAIIDALLGAAGLGDIGSHYPSSDPAYRGADSLELLALTVAKIDEIGWKAAYVDATILAEKPAVAPVRDLIEASLSRALGLSKSLVSVKATTTDGTGLHRARRGHLRNGGSPQSSQSHEAVQHADARQGRLRRLRWRGQDVRLRHHALRGLARGPRDERRGVRRCTAVHGVQGLRGAARSELHRHRRQDDRCRRQGRHHRCRAGGAQHRGVPSRTWTR